MTTRESTLMEHLLRRLHAARARRDREVRFSDEWHAADSELQAIERAIFRAPIEADGAAGARPSSAAWPPLHARERDAQASRRTAGPHHSSFGRDIRYPQDRERAG